MCCISRILVIINVVFAPVCCEHDLAIVITVIVVAAAFLLLFGTFDMVILSIQIHISGIVPYNFNSFHNLEIKLM